MHSTPLERLLIMLCLWAAVFTTFGIRHNDKVALGLGIASGAALGCILLYKLTFVALDAFYKKVESDEKDRSTHS